MTEVSILAQDLWRDGIGPDDQRRVTAMLARSAEPKIAADPALGELQLFAAWFDLLAQVRAEVPAATLGVAGRVVRAAAEVELARLLRAPPRIDAAIGELADALSTLSDADPHAAAARAWADLAIGDVAIMLEDAPAARRRYEAVTASNNPIALRLTAMLKLAGIALDRHNFEPARRWARKAMTLAEHGKRFEHATRARMLLGMLEYVSGDMNAMRKTLMPHAKTSVLARIFLASTERAGRAMPMLADGLREATERGDSLAYTLCILVGARRYAATGHDADALITLSAGIAQLESFAPHLSAVLAHERAEWKTDWGDERYRAAEVGALKLLESSTDD